MTLCHLEGPRYLLGYMAREDRVFLMDKQRQVLSYKLLLSVLQYQVRRRLPACLPSFDETS